MALTYINNGALVHLFTHNVLQQRDKEKQTADDDAGMHFGIVDDGVAIIAIFMIVI